MPGEPDQPRLETRIDRLPGAAETARHGIGEGTVRGAEGIGYIEDLRPDSPQVLP
ncbi:hypothetical protein [Streptosporangium sp. NPDC087985]|uniref:hypothetical protein n=1 Tax=Streptosporangium sp. NPDC087985 TaxID=3366196 RepID=UPI0038046E98